MSLLNSFSVTIEEGRIWEQRGGEARCMEDSNIYLMKHSNYNLPFDTIYEVRIKRSVVSMNSARKVDIVEIILCQALVTISIVRILISPIIYFWCIFIWKFLIAKYIG